MSNLFTPPFFVRLADPGMSFYDPLSKLLLNGKLVKEVTVITPHTGEWLRAGGLVKVSAPAAETTGKAPEGSPAPVSNATQNASTEPSAAIGTGEPGTAAQSLEDLLTKASGDLEEDLAAIKTAKAAQTSSSKTAK